MGPMDVGDIKSALVRFMRGNGGPNEKGRYLDWYVGLTRDPDQARKEQHQNPDVWLAIETRSFGAAREVKEFLFDSFTLMSEDHGGQDDSHFVYVFKLTEQTKPTIREARARRLVDAVRDALLK